MKTEDLRSYFILKSIKPLIAILITILVWSLITFSQNFFYKRNIAYKERNQKLENNLFSVIDGIEKAKSSYVVWEKIKNQNFDTVGLRVQLTKKIIDDLRQEYLVNNLDVNLSNPVVRKDLIKEKIGLEYSDFIITFQSYSDTEVFKFIDGLNKKMPGLLYYANINMKALDVDIDDLIVENIKKGGYKDLVQVRLVMVWQDFKDLKKSNVENAKK